MQQRFRRLKPAECGVGRKVPNVEFRDINGVDHCLKDFKNYSATVIAVTSTSCPLSKRFLPTLARLEKTYARDVRFVFVNSIASDSKESFQAAVQTHSLNGPYVQDKKGTLLTTLGAMSTTDCFVIDKALTLCYRGAIDDQYGIGYALDKPRQTLLANALDAVLAGQSPAIEATDAPGCQLKLCKTAAKATSKAVGEVPTYHNRVSRIIQNNCVECHRAGGVAPFSLTEPTEVAAHAAMISQVVKNGTMPPWFAAPTENGVASTWLNDRSLAPADKSDLEAWLNDDLPLGDPADAPIPPTFSDGWQIGEPDVILQLPKPIAIPAEGVMPYLQIVVPTDFDEDKWVSGFDIRPTAREVVHHIGVFVETGAQSEQAGNIAEKGGAYLALYVPGNSWRLFPSGCAKRLPKGTRLRFEIHYTPNGTATEDQSQLGLVFSKQPPQYELHMNGVLDRNLEIPPNADHHKETGSFRLPSDVQILSILPHMHARGKSFRFEAVSTSGASSTLLEIPRYDFNWQLAYHFAKPVSLPRGTDLKVTGWFDNSKQNPANPDPSKTVHWGPQSHEEMLLGYIEFIVPSEGLTGKSR